MTKREDVPEQKKAIGLQASLLVVPWYLGWLGLFVFYQAIKKEKPCLVGLVDKLFQPAQSFELS